MTCVMFCTRQSKHQTTSNKLEQTALLFLLFAVTFLLRPQHLVPGTQDSLATLLTQPDHLTFLRRRKLQPIKTLIPRTQTTLAVATVIRLANTNAGTWNIKKFELAHTIPESGLLQYATAFATIAVRRTIGAAFVDVKLKKQKKYLNRMPDFPYIAHTQQPKHSILCLSRRFSRHIPAAGQARCRQRMAALVRPFYLKDKM